MQKPNPNAENTSQMLRVDHAGEYGANRIYEGQLMVLGKSDLAPTLKHMLEQEQEHLQKFDQLLNDNKVRPSALMPLWHVAGLALGIGSALLGKKAAMACTVAVEEVIEEHYNSQIGLVKDEELKKTITKFRDEEVEHRNTGLLHNAVDMKGYAIFSGLIKAGAKVSIFLAKRFIFLLALIPVAAGASQLDEGLAALKQGNTIAAFNIIRPLATGGNPDAQFALCGMYYQAQGVPKNDYEAARWCHASAQNSNVEAMYNLALMYQNGEGVGQNFIEAKKWYKEAAERGHQNAQSNLAELDGSNTQAARKIAAQITPQQAPMPVQVAQQVPLQMQQPTIPQAKIAPNILPPQMIAAPISAPMQSLQPVQVASLAPVQMQNMQPASGNYASVKTVPDIEQPVIIVESNNVVDPYSACLIAAQRGEVYDICEKETSQEKLEAAKKPEMPETASNLKTHNFAMETESNFSAALELAKKGNSEAQNNLGAMYMTGNGVAKNYNEALKWLEKASSRGNVHAMMNLASMYRDGAGILPNKELAYSWYNLAADRSNSANDKQVAMENVQSLSKVLSNEQIGNALQYVTKLDEKIPQI